MVPTLQEKVKKTLATIKRSQTLFMKSRYYLKLKISKYFSNIDRNKYAKKQVRQKKEKDLTVYGVFLWRSIHNRLGIDKWYHQSET